MLRRGARRAKSGDAELIQIVDAALAETARKSGEWLACRPGCFQCCVGVFAINQLDAERLRKGMKELESRDAERAGLVGDRARDAVSRLSSEFPGDPITGLLDEGNEAEDAFAEFGNDEPCPALDAETGRCEVYAARPMTCRVFGPPVRTVGGLGTCELCYHGATEEQIASCEMTPDRDDLEAKLVDELAQCGKRGQTIVAWVLAGER